ncbi:MAG: 23S rRNA (adenine(2503)-C(2))-methyltransferase RlmN [Bacteroidetes bacterium]|nr:MAG: 23S rRNA (adenine(2503)-C(2))-methyltransferase RlmN [Bacteroidota bacterium]
MAEQQNCIRSLSIDELTDLITVQKEPSFRARQIHEWLWQKSASSFEEMSNIPASLRGYLQNNYVFNKIEVDTSQKSSDGTIKSGFKLQDDHLIEGVLIPTTKRMTACVSSQVGCSLSCTFCATGTLDRKRNLEHYEIYDQVVEINDQAQKNFDKPLSNIVYMGMGEPLLNYNNVLESIHFITSPEGLGMSPKRITVSTAGISKMIKKLGDDNVKFNLALSLHAADDAKRNKIMPINESNTLESLIEALNYFYQKTGNRITFEYIAFNNFNDSIEDAKNLASLCKKVPSKVNIIEYNPIDNVDFTKSTESNLDRFTSYLESQKIVAKVRKSRGKDIDAACGQLVNKS